jgi:L-rhamnose mutarotase
MDMVHKNEEEKKTKMTTEEKFRVWKVEMKDCKERISIKPAKTEAEIRELFGLPKEAKVTPFIDKRMKR